MNKLPTFCNHTNFKTVETRCIASLWGAKFVVNEINGNPQPNLTRHGFNHLCGGGVSIYQNVRLTYSFGEIDKP